MRYVDKLVCGVSAGSLFVDKPTIAFYPEVELCPHCGRRLHVQKSWEKTIVTMDIGEFKAKETVLECPYDKAVFNSPQLRALAPAQCTYGFDVIVDIGMSLFVHCRNEREIMKDLAARNIFISEREIGYQGRKFVVYLALAHRESRNQLIESMAKRGGYILHVDGTCEGDSPILFCGLDGISEIVLDNIKIPSERKELLIPFFQRIKEQYGDPVALVHDMGVGILMAVVTLQDQGHLLFQDSWHSASRNFQFECSVPTAPLYIPERNTVKSPIRSEISSFFSKKRLVREKD